jgi:ESS family glutamate:Na+ symporter
MSLRKQRKQAFTKSIFSTSTMIVSSLTLQGIIGFGLTFVAIATFFPDLFPSFGLFVPLGFELGFKGAGSVGLTFGAFGFLWACFGGGISRHLSLFTAPLLVVGIRRFLG